MPLPAFLAGIGAKVGSVTLGGIAKSLGSMLFGSKLRTGATMFMAGSMVNSSPAMGPLAAFRGY